jgi:hypothetical protein
MTRQNSQDFAGEVARQAQLYKNQRMPKSEETSIEDEEDKA